MAYTPMPKDWPNGIGQAGLDQAKANLEGQAQFQNEHYVSGSAQGGTPNSQASQVWGGMYPPPQQHPCPSCGYCPHCGRGGYGLVPNYPQPYWPYWTYPQTTGVATDLQQYQQAHQQYQQATGIQNSLENQIY